MINKTYRMGNQITQIHVQNQSCDTLAIPAEENLSSFNRRSQIRYKPFMPNHQANIYRLKRCFHTLSMPPVTL